VITSIRGILQSVSSDHLVIEVGGVGLQVSVPHSVLDRVPETGEAIFLHTHLAVRADALQLFGFSTGEEREFFFHLLQVSGVGPRIALAVLSVLSPDALRSAVVNDQPEVLQEVPGIGRKTAEKIIFYLKDRLAPSAGEAIRLSEHDNEVLGVLTTLGYNLVEAQEAIRAIPREAPEDVEQRVKLALQYFAPP
jgi:Holliday junction DNA helicase RuvA